MSRSSSKRSPSEPVRVSARVLAARLEKEGMSDDLTTQILERKVLDRILESSTIEDVVVGSGETEGRVETLDYTLEGEAEEEPTGSEADTDAASPESADKS